ncbi:MAG: MlaD family protein [Sulfuricurvum sp.]|nr:MlaD family protein [Sulfuricurvum sp.]
MESKVNYTVVGIFVLVLAMALISFAFWLGKYNKDDRYYARYYLYVTESVSGLAPEASVKFHGVDVGKVESIRINPNNSEEVELVLKIKKETPIRTDSTALLKFYGITGLAFIEIIGGSKNAPLLKTSAKEYAIIPTSPSLIKRLDESLSSVASKLSATLDRTDRVFSNRNINNLAQSLEHLRSLTAQIDGYQGEIKHLIEQTSATETKATETFDVIKESALTIKTTTGNIDTLTQTKITALIESLAATSRESHALIQKIESTVDRGDYNIQSASAPASAQLNALMVQMQVLSDEMESTLRSLRESPSDILFKKSAPNPGPGE